MSPTVREADHSLRARLPHALQRPSGLLLWLFALPALIGVASRLAKPKRLFADLYAVACGGQMRLAHQAVYVRTPRCPGLNAMPFNYPPWIADMAAGVIRTVGMGGLIAGYAVVFCLCLAVLVWLVLFSRRTPGTTAERIPALALITGSAISWGNVALPVYAVIALAVGAIDAAPLAFVAAVVLTSQVKPIFAANLLALLYSDRPLLERLAWTGLGGVACLAPSLAFLAFGGADAAAWRAQLGYFVLHDSPGFSLLGWLKLVGAATGGMGPALLVLAVAAALTGAGLLIAERGGLAPRERIWLGLMVAPLIDPRMMRYDAFLLGPGLVALAHAGERISPRLGRFVWWTLAGTLGVCLVVNLTAGGNQLLIAWLVLSALVLALALKLLPRKGPRAR